jgi:hypothetical protein
MVDSNKRVPGYPQDRVRPRKELRLRTFEYEMPFNYANVEMIRVGWQGSESHGVELNPTNSLCDRPEHLAADAIVISEDEPIVRVELIGSACTPPGYIMLEAEPIPGWRRSDEVAEVMPVRFRVDNLWGMHLRVDQWTRQETGEFTPFQNADSYPQQLPDWMHARKLAVKAVSREFPLAGMSCAVFAIPPSKKVRIMGGSSAMGWHTDNWPDDLQYSFRTVRITVADGYVAR